VLLQKIDELKNQVAERFGTRIFILHQATAALVGKSATKRMGQGDSAEAKGISFWADIMVTLSNADEETQCFKAFSAKLRMNQRNELLLKADPQYGRIRIADDYVEQKGGNGYVKKDAFNKIPDAVSAGGLIKGVNPSAKLSRDEAE
jgi:hypothetical protein